MDEHLQRLRISLLPRISRISAWWSLRDQRIAPLLTQSRSLFILSGKKIAPILRLWSVGCSQRPEGDRYLEKHFHRKHQVLIKGCLEPPYLLTARVFSIYVRQFHGIWEMECLSSRTACLLLHPIQLQCPIYYNQWHQTKQMAGVTIFVKTSILHLDNWGVKKRNSYNLLVIIDWTGTYNIIFGMKKG